MTNKPILYSFRRCPYAIRARLALLSSKTPCEIREVKLAAKPEAMLAASPKATVPVLVLPTGEVIDESLDIMCWALARHDPDQWLAREDKSLIAMNDGPFKRLLDRAKYPSRSGLDPEQARAAALPLLLSLESRLATSAFLDGNTPGLTDFALLPFIRQFAAIDPSWFAAQPLPQLQRWLAELLALPAFEAAMVRLVPWKPGDVPVLFGEI